MAKIVLVSFLTPPFTYTISATDWIVAVLSQMYDDGDHQVYYDFCKLKNGTLSPKKKASSCRNLSSPLIGRHFTIVTDYHVLTPKKNTPQQDFWLGGRMPCSILQSDKRGTTLQTCYLKMYALSIDLHTYYTPLYRYVYSKCTFLFRDLHS